VAGSWGQLLIGSGPPNNLTTAGGTATGLAYDCPGGQCIFSVVASAWGGATCGLYVLGPDGVTWINAGANTTFTGNNMGVVYLPPGQIQAQISGGPPTALFASIARVVG
jgi:hypothetical protein